MKGIKYPKTLALVGMILLAYFIFMERSFMPFKDAVSALGYVGTFILGGLYAYGFTAPPSAALFMVIASEQNLWLAAMVGGLGALISDIILFKLVRHSVMEEIRMILNGKFFMRLRSLIPIRKKHPFKMLLYTITGIFVLASPLPDEIGVSMLAVHTRISSKAFMIISYIANTVGILFFLVLGTTI